MTKFIRTGEGVLVFAFNLALLIVPIVTSALTPGQAVKWAAILDGIAVVSRTGLKIVSAVVTQTGVQPEPAADIFGGNAGVAGGAAGVNGAAGAGAPAGVGASAGAGAPAGAAAPNGAASEAGAALGAVAALAAGAAPAPSPNPPAAAPPVQYAGAPPVQNPVPTVAQNPAAPAPVISDSDEFQGMPSALDLALSAQDSTAAGSPAPDGSQGAGMSPPAAAEAGPGAPAPALAGQMAANGGGQV